MDSITQATLGAVIGYAGWGHRLGKRAAIGGAILGTCPDLDVVAGLAGQWSGLIHHRGVSHSLLFAPCLFFVFGFLFWKWLGKEEHEPGHWHALSFWVLWTHPMLDVFTPYGTQLFAPLTDKRYALDGISILDPLYTGVLFLGLLLAFLFRRQTRKARTCLAAALVITTAYVGLGFSQSLRAERWARQQLPTGFDTQELRAVPSLMNIWWWRIVARDTGGDLMLSQVSTWNPKPMNFTTVNNPESPLIDRMLEDPRGRTARWFAMDMVRYRIVEERLFTQVYMDDMRYTSVSKPLESLWGARAQFSPEGQLLKVYWEHRRDGMDPGKEIDALWQGITTGVVEVAGQSP